MRDVFDVVQIDGHWVVTTGGSMSHYEAQCLAAEKNGLPPPEPRRKAGRKPIYPEPMVRLTLYVRPDQDEWLACQANASAIVREQIDKLMTGSK